MSINGTGKTLAQPVMHLNSVDAVAVAVAVVAVDDFLERRDGADVEGGIADVADKVDGGTKSDDNAAVEITGSVEDSVIPSDCTGAVAVVETSPMRALRRRG